MTSRPLVWQGPFDIESFRAPRRGAFQMLRFRGIYRIHLVGADGVFIALPRLYQSDPTGTLYAGKAKSVFDRLKGFSRTIHAAHTGDRVAHRGGWNLYVFGLLKALSVPHGPVGGTRKLVAFAAVDASWTSDEVAKVEARLILNYRGTFGDNPPANLSSGEIGVNTKKVRKRVDASSLHTTSTWFTA